jgi:hypothetical protein
MKVQDFKKQNPPIKKKSWWLLKKRYILVGLEWGLIIKSLWLINL